jgi:hypothetical protein
MPMGGLYGVWRVRKQVLKYANQRKPKWVDLEWLL